MRSAFSDAACQGDVQCIIVPHSASSSKVDQVETSPWTQLERSAPFKGLVIAVYIGSNISLNMLNKVHPVGMGHLGSCRCSFAAADVLTSHRAMRHPAGSGLCCIHVVACLKRAQHQWHAL